MKLPFPKGTTYEVYQGNHGAFSHTGLNAYAWDFGLPEGSGIVAAAEGRVVRLKQDSVEGGISAAYHGTANTILLDHGNGLFTQYLHLLANSARVVEGQTVRGGQVLALSGNTGYSSTPHLHFQVQDCTGQSLPAAFIDVPGNGIPRIGMFCTSGNDGTGVSAYKGESAFPTGAFKCNGILIDATNLPAHLLHRDTQYILRGRVEGRPPRKIAVFLMKHQGGKPVMTVFANVRRDGTFTSQLNLTGLPRSELNWSHSLKQSNLFALALTPVEEDGSYWSTFSIQVSVR
jgi:murein DD-endopeptidase MepM/ murein hydrolase activator NlpD